MPSTSPGPAGRAAAMWTDLATAFLRRRGRRVVVGSALRPRAELWPLTQVLHAAALAADLSFARPGPAVPWDGLADGLRRFATPRGWSAGPWPQPRRVVFHDDNAWVGLALAQRALVTGVAPGRDARRALASVTAGEDAAGGVRWHERTASRHACSTAPGAMLALAVDPVGGAAFARRSLVFLDTVLAQGDLVRDNVDAAGVIDPAVRAYNQGSAIGAHRLAWQVLGDEASRRRCLDLAEAGIGWFSAEDRLWREPAIFAAVLLRQLLALDADVPSPRWREPVVQWADRVWQARDPATGLLQAGGPGHYDDGVVIDQAGAVQVLAALERPDGWHRLL